jgi:Asp-tRNA(Asn)/Glu-tRNA(Gln) amidotransferase A subunit family amidase
VAKAPLPEGPFAGVPFPLHDLCVSMAGSPTTGSSELFTGLV